MKKLTMFLMLALVSFCLFGCEDPQPTRPSAEKIQQRQQAAVEQSLNDKIGFPAVINGTERMILKQGIEMRDQMKLHTYTYTFAQGTGKFTFIGDSLGFPVSAATQFTSPSKVVRFWAGGQQTGHWDSHVVPQADPNGNYSPASSEGSFIMMINPKTGEPGIEYYEERLSTKLTKLPSNIVLNP
jgi:hypothetical protein